MATLRCGEHELPLTFTNHFLAHLQAATQRRFNKTGAGFFLTGTNESGGKPVTISQWVHPSTPLAFVYDVRDDDNQSIPPVELERKEIEHILEAMDQPVGVHDTSEVWLPFREKI